VSERVVVRWRARFVEVVVEAAVGCCCSALDEVVAVELLVVVGGALALQWCLVASV
jgi:hypothetical protein